MLSASTLQTMIDGKQINRYDVSSFLELVLSFVLGILVILISRFTPYWFVGISMLSLYGISVYGSYYLFNQHLILSDVSWIIIVITIVGMHSIFNRFILEFRLKQQIRKQFETYLNPKQVAELQKDPRKIKQDFKERGLPDINIGSGVNTGTCIVGNMGSDTRFDYSVIGDAVNLAARLEATTRNYKTEDGGIVSTLYSSYTMEKLKDIESVEVDKIKVKGKEELITIYKPK